RRHRAAPARGVHPAREPGLPAGGGEARVPRGRHPGAPAAHQRGVAGSRVLRADRRGSAAGTYAQVAEHPGGFGLQRGLKSDDTVRAGSPNECCDTPFGVLVSTFVTYYFASRGLASRRARTHGPWNPPPGRSASAAPRGGRLSSAILYVAIVAIWAGVLIPRWLRRDSSAQERDDDEAGPADTETAPPAVPAPPAASAVSGHEAAPRSRPRPRDDVLAPVPLT